MDAFCDPAGNDSFAPKALPVKGFMLLLIYRLPVRLFNVLIFIQVPENSCQGIQIEVIIFQ